MSAEAQVAPSRMTLQIVKQKKKGAAQGYQLLKKKSDALSSRFRGMLKEITKLSIGENINEAHFSMAKATWAGGNDLREQLMQRIKRPAVFVTAAFDNVAGVRLPVFQITTDPTVDSTAGSTPLGLLWGSRVQDSALKGIDGLEQLSGSKLTFVTCAQPCLKFEESGKFPCFTWGSVSLLGSLVAVLKNINLSAGGHVILAARDKYLEALSELVKLASLQASARATFVTNGLRCLRDLETAFFTLDSEIKMTNRRVNALNNVVLPKLDRCIGYITKELDEMEREEFFRLKKIQEKKKVAKEAELQALEAAQKEARAQGKLAPASILADDDEDIVF
ncbi:hypothetical protein Emag_003543 [Eimeria magna]